MNSFYLNIMINYGLKTIKTSIFEFGFIMQNKNNIISRYGKMIYWQILFAIAFFQTLTLLDFSLASRIDLQGNFTFCDVWNERRIVNLGINCSVSTFLAKKKQAGQNARMNFTVVVVKKLHYILDTYGIECYKKLVVRWLNSTFLGYKAECTYEVPMQITRLECLSMIETRQCDNQLMECDDDGCIYNQLPDGQYFWFSESKYTRVHCKFHRRRVLAETNASRVFANVQATPKQTCTPPALQCQLAHSIVIWNASDVSTLMFSLVHYGTGYYWHPSNKFLYSNQSKMIFQFLDDSLSVHGYTFRKTTVGLYLFMINSKLPFATQNLTALLGLLGPEKYQSNDDLIGLIEEEMAENDYKQNDLRKSLELAAVNELSIACSIFQNHLRLLASVAPSRSFHRLSNMHGEEIIVFAHFNQLFIPRCVSIDQISIELDASVENKEDKCFIDLPVRASLNGGREQLLFLTRENFLIDWAERVQCNLVNSRHWLNSTHFILRQGNTVSLSSPADILVVDLTVQRLEIDDLNFDHNQQIVDGFEIFRKYHDLSASELFVKYGRDEHYRVMPRDSALNEKHSVFLELTNSVRSEFSLIWSGLKLTIKLLIFSLSLCGFFFFIYCFIRIRQRRVTV